MIEQTAATESIASPEPPSSVAYYAGLHPRLLIGKEALDPTKQDLPSIISDLLGNIAQRDYSAFTNASARESKAYWDQKSEVTYEAKRQAWVIGYVATFDDAKTFFKDTDKGKNWSEFYSKLGIDTQNFTNQTAEALYTKYFLNQPEKLGIKQFVTDVLNAHNQDGKINMTKLESNLAGVSWLSKIFGATSSEVITQMVMAEAMLLANPEQLIQQANHKEAEDTSSRINNLNGDEQRLLKFLWKTPAQPTAAQAPTQPTTASPATQTETQDAQPTQAQTAEGTGTTTESPAVQPTQVETQSTAAPAEINPLGREALGKIRRLGLTVNADTNFADLAKELRNKDWNVDLIETQEYIEAAINAAETETPRKLELEPAEGNIRYLTAETKAGGDTKTIYLDSSLRGQLNVKPGETIILVLNGEKQVVSVARPRLREDGTIEGPETNSLRVSTDVLNLLNLPKGYATLPSFNAATKEIILNQPEDKDSPVVKIRQPRNITYVKDTTGNVAFLTEDDLARFGLTDGENIKLRLGGVTRELTVKQSRATVAGASWRFSEDLTKELNFPSDLSVRSSFDKGSKILSIGPGLAVYGKRNESGKYALPYEIDELGQRAKEYGGYIVIIDPNKQSAEDITAGFVQGLIYINGSYFKTRVPRPDVLYDEGSAEPLTQNATMLTKYFAHELMPQETRAVASDKLHFDWVLKDYGLADYRPESLTLSDTSVDELEAFFNRHPDVMIKPQYRSGGKGVISVTKQPEGFVITERRWDTVANEHTTKQTSVASLVELLNTIPNLDAMKGVEGGLSQAFIQERINLMEYEYNDPQTQRRLIGQVEPRIVVQRGIDGRIKIGGMEARVQNNVSNTPHNLNLLWLINNIYHDHPDREKKVRAMISELEITVTKTFQAIEQQSKKVFKGRPLGQLIVDLGLTSDFKLKMIEADARANNYQEERMGGAMEYSLFLTGMN